MGRMELRDAVATKFSTKFKSRTDCKIQYENGPVVDMGQLTVPVICYEVIYEDSQQAEFNENPMMADTGAILVTILVKEASGNKVAITLREECATLLQRQFLGGATMAVGRLLPNSNLVKGWVGYRVSIPFRHYHY